LRCVFAGNFCDNFIWQNKKYMYLRPICQYCTTMNSTRALKRLRTEQAAATDKELDGKQAAVTDKELAAKQAAATDKELVAKLQIELSKAQFKLMHEKKKKEGLLDALVEKDASIDSWRAKFQNVKQDVDNLHALSTTLGAGEPYTISWCKCMQADVANLHAKFRKH
jgi:hypothetical protein